MTEAKPFPLRPNNLAAAPFSWHYAAAVVFFSIVPEVKALNPGLGPQNWP